MWYVLWRSQQHDMRNKDREFLRIHIRFSGWIYTLSLFLSLSFLPPSLWYWNGTIHLSRINGFLCHISVFLYKALSSQDCIDFPVSTVLSNYRTSSVTAYSARRVLRLPFEERISTTLKQKRLYFQRLLPALITHPIIARSTNHAVDSVNRRYCVDHTSHPKLSFQRFCCEFPSDDSKKWI